MKSRALCAGHRSQIGCYVDLLHLHLGVAWALRSSCCVQSVEAARECGMRAVVVAGRKPLYELGAADLVVRGLDELSFINLKQLFSNEEGVEGNVSFSCPYTMPGCRSDRLSCTSNCYDACFAIDSRARLPCVRGGDVHSCSLNS